MKRVIKSSTNPNLIWDYYETEKCWEAMVDPDAEESELETIEIINSPKNGKFYLLLNSGSGYAEACGGDSSKQPSLDGLNDAKTFANNIVIAYVDSKRTLDIYKLADMFGPVNI